MENTDVSLIKKITLALKDGRAIAIDWGNKI